MKDYIYLDNSASTRVDDRVIEAMLPYLAEEYGNPSSMHRLGQSATAALADARDTCARFLACSPDEIIFTSCATESNNFAIRGIVAANDVTSNSRKHIITSAIEHASVLETCRDLERNGCEVTFVPVDSGGLVNMSDVEKAIRDNTALITIMYANAEVGTIQPVAEIGEIARRHEIPFHTDATQAVQYLDCKVDNLSADALSISAHKFHGPKGIGLLYVRSGTPLQNLLTGGHHELGRRAGTENVASIVALATALSIVEASRESVVTQVSKLRDKLLDGILRDIPNTSLNGTCEPRLPNNVNVSFEGVEGEALILRLDLEGIAASTGSACASRASGPSHVLTAMGQSPVEASGTLRLTLGKFNTEEEIDRALDVLKRVVKQLRDISPIYNSD